VADAAPDKLRGTLRSGWTSMGIQLDEAPPERTVLGWEIRRSTPDYVVLGTACRIAMKGEMLFMRRPHQLLYCTFVELDDDDARAVWAGVEPYHPRLVRRLLESASAPH
jgi:hypothetical protein